MHYYDYRSTGYKEVTSGSVYIYIYIYMSYGRNSVYKLMDAKLGCRFSGGPVALHGLLDMSTAYKIPYNRVLTVAHMHIHRV